MYIDANRSLNEPDEVAVAPGCAAASELHDLYHYTIDAAVRRIAASHRHGRVLLLDIHGQAKHPEAILIGTRNGATADLKHLHTTGEGFLWHLRELLGSTVAPALGETEYIGYQVEYIPHDRDRLISIISIIL
jgi:hypothetical protein